VYDVCAGEQMSLGARVNTLHAAYYSGRTRSNSIVTLLRYSAAAAKRRGAAAVVAGTHVTWWFTGGGGDDDVGRGRGRLGGRKHMDCARCQQHLLGLGRLLPSRRKEVNGLAKLCYPVSTTADPTTHTSKMHKGQTMCLALDDPVVYTGDSGVTAVVCCTSNFLYVVL